MKPIHMAMQTMFSPDKSYEIGKAILLVIWLKSPIE